MDKAGFSVETFRQQLQQEVRDICTDRQLNFNNETKRGQAFQYWTAHLIAQHEGLEVDPDECVFLTNDLKFDVVIEDGDQKTLYFAQTKFVSVQANPPLIEVEVTDFFSRHQLLKNDTWVPIPDSRWFARIRVAPLKLAGLPLLHSGIQSFTTVKSADEYRAQARSVRKLAERMIAPEERRTLLDIAERYERLAQQADKPKTGPRSD